MYLGGLEWDFDAEPTHLKPYAQEILANLIAVHAEVSNFHRVAQNLEYVIIFDVRFFVLHFLLLSVGTSSRAGLVGADSVSHSGDYSGGTCTTHVVRHAVSSSWNYSSTNGHNTFEKRSAGLQYEQSEVKTVFQTTEKFIKLELIMI